MSCELFITMLPRIRFSATKNLNFSFDIISGKNGSKPRIVSSVTRRGLGIKQS